MSRATAAKIGMAVLIPALGIFVAMLIAASTRLLGTPHRLDQMEDRFTKDSAFDDRSFRAVRDDLRSMNDSHEVFSTRLVYNVEQTNRVYCMLVNPKSVMKQAECIMEENRKTGVSPYVR